MKSKSHTALGISFAEYGALLGTRTLLASNLITHTTSGGGVTPGAHKFNMCISCMARDCGSVSCIGGTMALIMGKTWEDAAQFVRNRPDDRLRRLFYPGAYQNLPLSPDEWDKLTGRKAVKAIDNFLAGAGDPWKGIAYK